MKTHLDKALDRAIAAASEASSEAKEAGDLPTMYAANRAWHQLVDAKNDIAKRRQTLASPVVSRASHYS